MGCLGTLCLKEVPFYARSNKGVQYVRVSGVLRCLVVFVFYQQLSSGEIAPFSLVQLEVIFNPTKPGNAVAEFEISFSDPLSPPVSRNKYLYIALVQL